MTTVAEPVNLTSAHLLRFLRDNCENDFRFFVSYFFKVRTGFSFIFGEHHDRIIDELMRIWRGEPAARNTMFNLPPRYGKTELIVILFVAWCFVKNPRCKFIHISYADELVTTNSDAVKEILTSVEFKQLWPHIKIKPNRNSKHAWDTVQGGVFFARAAGGMLTGFGAGQMSEYDEVTDKFVFSGCMLIDDPLKPDDAESKPKRTFVNTRWERTIKSRRNSKRTPTIVVMQRLHQEDFAAHVMSDTSEPWNHVRMPALVDEGMPTERALWPAKHNVIDLKAMRDRKNDRGQSNPLAGAVFAGQYQQDPKPYGGGIYKIDWWRYYADLAEVKKRCTWYCITADTAYTKDDANDPSGFYFWGAEGGKRLYLLDRLHGRWEFPELLKEASNFWQKHPEALRFYIEAKASGMSLGQSMSKNRTDLQKRAGAKIKLWKPEDYRYPKDKVGRANKSSWTVFNGEVWLPSDTIAPWVTQFVDEHSAFTADMTHAHDEDVDGQTMAVSIWTYHGGGTRNEQSPKDTPRTAAA